VLCYVKNCPVGLNSLTQQYSAAVTMLCAEHLCPLGSIRILGNTVFRGKILRILLGVSSNSADLPRQITVDSVAGSRLKESQLCCLDNPIYYNYLLVLIVNLVLTTHY